MMQLSVQEISRRLADRAESVCQRLLPGGKRVKGEWVCGDISGAPGDSLKVHLDGPHAGHWVDWANQHEHKGDLVDLWRFTRSLTPGEAIREAKQYLGYHEPYSLAEKAWSRPQRAGDTLHETGRAMTYLVHERKLEPSIIHLFGVKGDAEKGAIIFPSHAPSGEVINHSYRTIPKKDGEKKAVWQEKGCAPSLFGWQAVTESAYLQRTILLCEGQIDAMTWRQWGQDALSIPNGSGQSWIEYEWDNLAAFDNIYLSFDMDGPGRSFVEKAITRLGRHRCLVVTLPGKDANDCLRSGHSATDAAVWLIQAKPMSPQGVAHAPALKQRWEEYGRPKPEPFTLPFFRVAWPHEGLYFRPGEMTVWTGHTSHGKSTLLNFMAATLAIIQQPVFICSLETSAESILHKATEICTVGGTARQARSDAFDEIAPFLFFGDVVGTISRESLFEMLYYCFQRHGVQHFIIDSLMRIEGLEEDNPAQTQFMGDLQGFCKKTGAHVHLVCHPRKPGRDDDDITVFDVKGSINVPNNTDNQISVGRNAEKTKLRHRGELTPLQESDMHDTTVRVLKQREGGWLGTFYLRYHPRTYSFSPMPGGYKPETK